MEERLVVSAYGAETEFSFHGNGFSPDQGIAFFALVASQLILVPVPDQWSGAY
jgi:hypothetical protein